MLGKMCLTVNVFNDKVYIHMFNMIYAFLMGYNDYIFPVTLITFLKEEKFRVNSIFLSSS